MKMEMKRVFSAGLGLFVIGGLSFLLISGSQWLHSSTIAQYLNFVAWFIALIGLFSAAISGLILVAGNG